MIDIFNQQKELGRYAGPGHWNDPDMLEVGNGGMTTEEYKTHFSLWCMLASPLIAGNDIQNMTSETKSILMNKELIAINQDSLGRQAVCYRDNVDYQIWVKALSNNEKAICLLNKSDEKKTVLVDFALLLQVRAGGGSGGSGAAVQHGGASLKPEDFIVRDLWDHKDLVLKESSMYIDLIPHSVKIYRLLIKSINR
jgi:alpha-galactosidase